MAGSSKASGTTSGELSTSEYYVDLPTHTTRSPPTRPPRARSSGPIAVSSCLHSGSFRRSRTRRGGSHGTGHRSRIHARLSALSHPHHDTAQRGTSRK